MSVLSPHPYYTISIQHPGTISYLLHFTAAPRCPIARIPIIPSLFNILALFHIYYTLLLPLCPHPYYTVSIQHPGTISKSEHITASLFQPNYFALYGLFFLFTYIVFSD